MSNATVPLLPPAVIATLQRVVLALEFPDWAMTGMSTSFSTVFGPAAAAFEQALSAVAPGAMKWLNDYAANNAHPLAKKLPLMTPGPMLFAMFMYVVVLALCLLPNKDYGLRTVSFVHNFALTVLSAYMMVGIFLTAVVSFGSGASADLWNVAAPTSGGNAWIMAKFISLFYLSKIWEFADTWIMALRGHRAFAEGSKISFLHTYHHLSIFPIWFFVTLEGPGGAAWWSAFANSLIHTIMYFYMASTCIERGSSFTFVREYLDPVKFYITKMQMLQFVTNNLQSGYIMWIAKVPAYPLHLVQLLFYYMLTLLALFYNFLRVNEAKAKAAKAAQKKNEEAAGTGVARVSQSPARPSTRDSKKKQ